MTEALFQVFECCNTDCRLRFPGDLSVKILTTCPRCSAQMLPVGEPFSNYHRPKLKPEPVHANLSLLLDNLRGTENVGSIFRSANGAGVSHIYCCGTTPTPAHPKVRKASLGAEDDTPWSYHLNSVDLASELTNAGKHLIALESTSTSSPLYDFSLRNLKGRPLVLAIGNEISGIDPQLLKMAAHNLYIPMYGEKTSLNAAVSAGIALYYLIHQTKEHG